MPAVNNNNMAMLESQIEERPINEHSIKFFLLLYLSRFKTLINIKIVTKVSKEYCLNSEEKKINVQLMLKNVHDNKAIFVDENSFLFKIKNNGTDNKNDR